MLLHQNQPWGYRWRSSKTFILSSMSMALFTDELLFAFMVPLLPYILEQRIGSAAYLTQRYISLFLAEGALVSVLTSPIVGVIADRISSKKLLLLALLVLALISVVCLSLTTALPWLFIGRFFQCIVSNALWIVGMTTMTENLGSEHMGKISGLTSMLTSAGTLAGPVMSGSLFGLGGYWVAWSGAIVFLVTDIIMRLVMIEKPKEEREINHGEQDPLLNERQSGEDPASAEMSGWRFYACLFRQPRFTAGILSFYMFAVLIASFESTLSVHVREAFGWGVFPVGLLLASIQGPGAILAPIVGYMKDRVGSRVPTTLGFLSLVPFLFLMGLPGDDRFPWANVGIRGKVIFLVCMSVIGCFLCLLHGVGTMEATETVDELEKRHPGIFGPNGGYSRALSITSMSWTMGLLTGPVLAGLVADKVGYFELQCILTAASLLAGINAAFHLSSAKPKNTGN